MLAQVVKELGEAQLGAVWSALAQVAGTRVVGPLGAGKQEVGPLGAGRQEAGPQGAGH